jgi:uncharacterized membrane protein YqiK
MLERPNLSADPTVKALKPALGSKTLLIKTADDYECAAIVLMQAKTNLDVIETARLKITGPLNEALKAANEQARTAKAPYLQEEVTIKTAMKAYDDIQDEIREEEQRKANADAQAERDRLQGIADAATEKAEKASKALREEAEHVQAEGDTRAAEKLLGRADSIESRELAKADVFNERASQVVAVVSDRAAPKVSGITIPKVWDFEVIDEKLIPDTYFDLNSVRLRKVVVALKGLCNIPGIRVFQKKQISAGRR